MKALACIDRSPFAASVCDHAARSTNTVELLHVIEQHPEPVPAGDLSGRLGLDTGEALLLQLAAIDEERNRLAQQRARILLDDAADRVRAAGALHVTQRLVQGGLVRHLKDHGSDADLIVVGRRGEAGEPSKHHLGRNLEGVIRASHRPVLVVPQTFEPIRRYLFAFDGGRSATTVISFMFETGLLKDVEGTLLYVGQDSGPVASALSAAAEQLRSAGFTISTSVRSGEPEEVILAAMENEGYDLLVMGAFGHSRIRELLVGSTTTEVLQRCSAPLLVVH